MQLCKGCSCSECMVMALRALVLTLLAHAFIIHCAPPLFAGGRSKPKENPMKRCAIYVFKLQDGSLFERVITARGACSSQYIDTGQRQQQSIRSKSSAFPQRAKPLPNDRHAQLQLLRLSQPRWLVVTPPALQKLLQHFPCFLPRCLHGQRLVRILQELRVLGARRS